MVERKLTTIVAADIAGFSRLVGLDEEGTLAAQRAHRVELVDPLIAEHGGRVANTAGDSLVIEFPSAVEAVRCALAVQAGMAERNAGVPEDRRILYRVGINVGDVIADGGDLLGDGVNIAARLENVCAPGGICLSRTTYDQIRDRVDIDLDDLGEIEVKNIVRPVRIYSLRGAAASAPAPPGPRARRSLRLAAALAVLVLALGATAGFLGLRPDGWDLLGGGPAPGPPGIAVLPFDNMSGDPGQDYFSDGITEDLITDLSRFSGLFVIARNSVFAYKDRAANAQQVGRELGVTYLVEGSVRRDGNRVRINAQLVDASNGRQLWANRYDRDLTDVFALQDEVVGKIVTALSIQLTEDDDDRLKRAPKIDPRVYDLVLRGRERFAQFTPESVAEARSFFERAIALDRQNAAAHAGLAYTYSAEVVRGWVDDPEASIGKALDAILAALALDESLPLVHFVLGNIRIAQRRPDEARSALQRAIELDPNYADAYAGLAQANTFAGEPEEALAKIGKAMKLNPHRPFIYSYVLGHALFVAERYEEARAELSAALDRNPDFLQARVYLAASHAYLGNEDDAAWEVAEILGNFPDFDSARARISAVYTHPRDLDRLLNGLRLAGLPERAGPER